MTGFFLQWHFLAVSPLCVYCAVFHSVLYIFLQNKKLISDQLFFFYNQNGVMCTYSVSVKLELK